MKAYMDLQGVIPALITPLNKDRTVDVKNLKKIVRELVDRGINGILALGTAGEGPLFCEKDRDLIVRAVKETVENQVPLIVGVDALSTAKAIEDVNKVAKYGANYALVLPPFYVPIPEEEVFWFYKELASESPIPVIIYNIPQLTSVKISVNTVERISKLENIAGIKDSGGDITWFQNMQNACQSPSFKVFQGMTTLWFVGSLLGADGIIDPSINIIAEWDIELFKAVKAGEYVKAKRIQRKLLELANAYSAPGYSVYLGVKAALSLMGICGKTVLKPFKGFDKVREEKLAEGLKKLGLI